MKKVQENCNKDKKLNDAVVKPIRKFVYDNKRGNSQCLAGSVERF